MTQKKSNEFFESDDGDGFSITINHCVSWSVFKKRALTIFNEVRELLPKDLREKITLKLNENGKPARGSFEISVQKTEQEPILIWSGLKKGPPRKEKFPETSNIINDIKKALK